MNCILVAATCRPILLKGHERPLTCVAYNEEGDLLVTCAKDNTPTVWYADTGDRLGTFPGHNGSVYTCSISGALKRISRKPSLISPSESLISLSNITITIAEDSQRLLTASADSTMKLWDVSSGSQLGTIVHQEPTRGVAFAIGSCLAAATTDAFMSAPASVRVYKMPPTGREDHLPSQPEQRVDFGNQRVTRARFGPLNQTIVASDENGTLRMLDTETGQVKEEVREAHSRAITDLQFSHDMTHFITSSADKEAKLWDSRTLRHLKTYTSDRPLNAAAISPLMDHVVLGGGQEAMAVTQTASKAGKFESKLYHKIFEEELGTIKGHFGPINAIAFAPDGRSFTTGGEDGFARVHFFDKEVLKLNLTENLEDKGPPK